MLALRGNLNLAAGQLEPARHNLEQAVNIDPTRWTNWFQLVRVHQLLNNFVGMAHVADHLVENAGIAVPFLRRALASQAPGSPGLVLADVMATRDILHETASLAAAMKAVAWWQDGERLDALADLERTVTRLPDQLPAWIAAWKLLIEAPEVANPGRIDDGEAASTTARVWAAMLHQIRGEHDEALTLLETGLDGPPAVVYGWVIASRAYTAKGSTDLALHALTQAGRPLRHERCVEVGTGASPRDAWSPTRCFVRLECGHRTRGCRFRRRSPIRTRRASSAE